MLGYQAVIGPALGVVQGGVAGATAKGVSHEDIGDALALEASDEPVLVEVGDVPAGGYGPYVDYLGHLVVDKETEKAVEEEV